MIYAMFFIIIYNSNYEMANLRCCYQSNATRLVCS